ncbi:MAG TPA: HAMP domain-containing sensor histidine kinase [Chthoniobacterales bacterium]|nr:HAMP domain-containing sensor histidine kinase [Chthoniobacterales bacterium]
MKTFWSRICLWLLLTFLGVSAAFFGTVAWFQVSGQRFGTGTPNVNSNLETNQHDGISIVLSPTLLISYGILVVVALAAAAWLVTRTAFNPIVLLNDQLDVIEPHNLSVQIRIDTDEPELQELQKHINDLLSRVSLTVHQLQSYSAQVAHELRAPLTIIRLKIEEAADKIEPALAEEIQTELLRLTMHVEQALLIARAEQGHLKPDRIRFDLADLLNDVAEDFRLLARDQERQIEVVSGRAPINADPRYFKQILYSLLTNSLRHGKGTIYASVQTEPDLTVLTIKNQIKPEDSDEAHHIGLGRRIVAALVALQGNIELRTTRPDGWYEVSLLISEKNGLQT